MNEAETRAEQIDPVLATAGWGVVEGSRIRREFPITLGRLECHGRRGKALTADYVLIYRNTKLAVVEAKAWDEPISEGVGQAKRYAGKLAIRFTYSTNGQGIYGIDMQTGTEGEVSAFPTPQELWQRTFAEVNEAHAMSRGALQKFLTLLERIPNKRLVLFTTTELPSKDVFGEFDSALASRCKVFTLAGRNSPATEKAFAEKARTVAQAEGLDGKPLEHYVALAKRCDCNLRRMYQQIEAGAMSA